MESYPGVIQRNTNIKQPRNIETIGLSKEDVSILKNDDKFLSLEFIIPENFDNCGDERTKNSEEIDVPQDEEDGQNNVIIERERSAANPAYDVEDEILG